MPHSSPYPLDFDSLKKGSIIPPGDVSEAIEMDVLDKNFALKALALAQQIEVELAARGEAVTVCVRQGAIHVLTDEEASIYNDASFERGIRRLLRAHRRMMSVDTKQLSEGRKQEHSDLSMAQARQILAIKKERKALLQPHQDKRPGLLDSQHITPA